MKDGNTFCAKYDAGRHEMRHRDILKKLTAGLCVMGIVLSGTACDRAVIERPPRETGREMEQSLSQKEDVASQSMTDIQSGKTEQEKEHPAAGNSEEGSKTLTPKVKTSELESSLYGNEAHLVLARSGLREVPQSMQLTSGLTPSVPAYDIGAGLSNVSNVNDFYFSNEAMAKLQQNQFVVSKSSGFSEFYELYEDNAYWMTPSFVTVDSLMHTYHLYFTVLMKKTEKTFAAPKLQELSRAMLERSRAQYETLKGTEWESAALRNVIFFTVGLKLQDPNVEADPAAAELVQKELDKIYAAEGLADCGLFGPNDAFIEGKYKEDYSQYKPRGNYEGDPVLEAYFRAMMWYGRISFLANDEDSTRSALLITLALDGDRVHTWEEIYQVTAYFAGASDDCIYYEYAEAARDAYHDGLKTAELVGNAAEFKAFRKKVEDLEPPRINSLPKHKGAEKDESGKCFRFMGQRYNIDGEIYERLTEFPERRQPDALDVPNALGSPAAEKILQEKGDMAIPIYKKELPLVRDVLKNAGSELWYASLYSGWLNTLTPLLSPRGAGYPVFMQNEEWLKKTLETYESSYTELKHDTVLYAKQVFVAEGDGEPDNKDDRGYVEPEPEVYARFAALSEDTKNGLDKFGMLDQENREMLDGLTALAVQLRGISEKELRNEILSDEEYDLIRYYGRIIEQYWEAYKNDLYASGLDYRSQLNAALVTDIASGDDWVLEIGTGLAQDIYVIAPVAGQLKIVNGSVYSFYQFTTKGERLTDSEWCELNGFRPGPNDRTPDPVPKPAWTMSYRADM